MLWLRTMFFPVVHAPFEKWICWPRTNAASQTSTCFSASLWERERVLCLIKACDPSPPYLLFLFAIRYWQAFLFHWADCSREWLNLIRHVGGHVSIEAHDAVKFTEFLFPVYVPSCKPPLQTCWTTAPPVGCKILVSKSANILPPFLLTTFADCWFSEMHI